MKLLLKTFFALTKTIQSWRRASDGFDNDASYKSGLCHSLMFAAIFYFASIPCVAANDKNSLNYFLYSYGPASRPTLYLGWVFAALAIFILILIILLLLWAIFHRRRNEDLPSADDSAGLRWIYIGTGISTFILFILAVYSLTTLNTIAKPAAPPVLTLTVTGYDWWWKIDYEANGQSPDFVTANELHIPVGVPVLVKLKSADVIHAFWAPLLAGKTQMIPGMVNQQWLQADAEGVYHGQCTQYCGLQHAHMGLEVVAQSAAEFGKWRDNQLKPAKIDSGIETNEGKKLFMDRCAGCHTVRGTEARGNHAPDLTHLKSRRLLAAGLITNSPEHLIQFITHVQDLKPGARMPSMQLTPAEITTLSVFLSTLD